MTTKLWLTPLNHPKLTFLFIITQKKVLFYILTAGRLDGVVQKVQTFMLLTNERLAP